MWFFLILNWEWTLRAVHLQGSENCLFLHTLSAARVECVFVDKTRGFFFDCVVRCLNWMSKWIYLIFDICLWYFLDIHTGWPVITPDKRVINFVLVKYLCFSFVVFGLMYFQNNLRFLPLSLSPITVYLFECVCECALSIFIYSLHLLCFRKTWALF